MLLLVLAPFALAAFSPVIARVSKNYIGYIAAVVPAAMTAYLVTFIPTILNGDTVTRKVEWAPTIGIDLTFYIDGLSLMMGLLVAGVGALVFIYANGYLHGDEGIGRFYIYLSMFMGAMLGVVLSSNLIALFIFWELTSISSYLLIGYKHKYRESRAAATQALFITGGGGLLLMAGLLLVGAMGGTLEYTELLALPANSLIEHPLYSLALAGVLMGAFTKSAQMPFHTWLTRAMAAPTPVSAYLHSATMVKAGIYLLARMLPILGGSTTWFYVVTTVGAVTMIIAAFLSWQNSDLKKILAYSTISVLGTLTMLMGLGHMTHYAVEAAFVFWLAHAFYKGCLFMVAGSIDHETGTREIDQLGGLGKVMPITFAAAAIASLSKAGIPLLFGFIGKELLYEATLHAPWIVALTVAAVLANAMVGTSAALVVLKPFWGREIKSPKHAHEAPLSMWVGPVILSIFSLLYGLFPFTLDQFGTRVVAAMSPSSYEDLHLAIWHGASLIKDGAPTPLLLSAITVALAAGLYIVRDSLLPIFAPLKGDAWGPQQWYEWVMSGLLNSAETITRTLQNGNLRYYNAVILLTTIGLITFTLATRTELILAPVEGAPIRYFEIVLFGVIILAALATAWFNSRLAAIAALGVIGFGIAALFIFYGAPDLAMTQFAIETLAIVLIALIMGRLPRYFPESGISDRLITGTIAAAAGTLMFVLVLLTLSIPPDSQLSPFFAANTEELAHGHNIVNVILVDFRGFDTFGEITVLAIAGIGVYALSKLHITDENIGREDDDPNEEPT